VLHLEVGQPSTGAPGPVKEAAIQAIQGEKEAAIQASASFFILNDHNTTFAF